MYFKQFLHDDLGCSSYFIASRDSREAVIVDPQLDIQPYIHLARERHYRIVGVIDTHIHADHISGNRALAAATGAALYLHEQAGVAFPFTPVHDGDEITIGQVVLRIVHTPGHRPEAISIAVTNPPRSPEPSMVLSGDTLFVGDVGRPDFGGREGAREQYRSVQRLLTLPDYVEVFPAHFEGSCGKAMCGRPSSTIGFERRFNPLLQLSQPDFVSLASEVPARPLNMSAIIATNLGQGDYPWAMPRDVGDVPTIPVEQAPSWLRDHKAAVIDVREPEEYAAGHLPGAVSIPQADLASRMGEIPKDRDLLVVCAGATRSPRCVAFLRSMGFDRATNMAGGTDAWIDAGYPVEAPDSST